MKIFITIFFWLLLIDIVSRIICIVIVDYPRTTSRLQDILQTILGIPILLWAFYLICK